MMPESGPDKTDRAYIYLDGGSRGNPGPSAIAYIIKSSDQGTVLAEESKYIGETTNNVAEYTALLSALEHAGRMGIKDVLVRSDSKLTVRQVSGKWAVRNERMRQLCAACQLAARAFRRFRIEHIRRELNAEADKMVRIVLKAEAKSEAAHRKSEQCGILEPEAVIHVAGSVKGQKGHAAAAYIITDADGQVLATQAMYLGRKSPDVADYAAIYISAKKAESLGLRRVLFKSDNMLVVKQLCGEFKVKSEKLIKPHAKCRQALAVFEDFGIEHISRESNEAARQMASEAKRAHEEEDSRKEADNRSGLEAEAKKTHAEMTLDFEPDGIIFAAGSFKGASGHAGASFIITTPDELVIADHSRYLGSRPANVPEYAAVFLSAKRANSLGLKKVIIKLDNVLVAKQLAGEYKVKSDALKKPYADCIQALGDFERFAIQVIARPTNKTAHRMALKAIKDHEKEEDREDTEGEKGNPASARMVQDSELDS
ncbi:MAG: reverse transcriptase-like protein [Candidatus Coatesbacteria bacterium]|nr:reverse transcriptase-like protein [Candidatus Coatesbacteria bacterium]